VDRLIDGLICGKCYADRTNAEQMLEAQQDAARAAERAVYLQKETAEKESFCRYYKNTTGKDIHIADVVNHPGTGKWVASADLAAEKKQAAQGLVAAMGFPFQWQQMPEADWDNNVKGWALNIPPAFQIAGWGQVSCWSKKPDFDPWIKTAQKVGKPANQVAWSDYCWAEDGTTIITKAERDARNARAASEAQAKSDREQKEREYAYASSNKHKIVALILWLLFGVFGGHRFYVGKKKSAVAYIFTAGMFGVGLLVDLLLILAGKFKDKSGNYLR
jgi:hypothetical protein